MQHIIITKAKRSVPGSLSTVRHDSQSTKMLPTPPWKRKREVKRLIPSIDAEIKDMLSDINSIPKTDPNTNGKIQNLTALADYS